MKYCKKCIMPDTKPDLIFDGEDVCVACRAAEIKHNKINWKERRKNLDKVFDEHRGNDPKKYDCVIPISGGKDSTYQAYTAKYIYKMNPLCVNFEPTYMSEIGRRNLENIRAMGFDILSFKPNKQVYTKLGKEAFARVGDHEWPNHVGIFTVPVKIAVLYGIKLIIWGENSQLEYGGPMPSAEKDLLDRRWLEEFGGLLGLRVSDLPELGISEEDMKPYVYPSEEELKKVGVRGIFLGYYLKWDARRHVEFIKKHGFNVRKGMVEGTYVNYENLDDEIVSIHDYFKYIKFGFGRTSDHAALDIRNGRMNRRDGLIMVARLDGKLFPQRVKMFCERYDMDEKEFYATVEKYANKSIFKVDENGKLVWENGQLVNLALKRELEASGLSDKDVESADIGAIIGKIDLKVEEEIRKDGYVTCLLDSQGKLVEKV